MKIGELIEILNKYPKDTEIKVLEKIRPTRAGFSANIINTLEVVNMYSNKIELHIETDYNYGSEKEYEYKDDGGMHK